MNALLKTSFFLLLLAHIQQTSSSEGGIRHTAHVPTQSKLAWRKASSPSRLTSRFRPNEQQRGVQLGSITCRSLLRSRDQLSTPYEGLEAIIKWHRLDKEDHDVSETFIMLTDMFSFVY